MKKVKLNLIEYLRLGGKLNNLNFPDEVKITATDSNTGLGVENVLQDGNNVNKEPMYKVYYIGGRVARYHGMWIDVDVQMRLDNSYLS